MNRKIKKIDFTQRVIDLVLVFAAWWISYALKFVFEVGGQGQENVTFQYIAYGVLITIVSMVTFKNTNVYETYRDASFSKEIGNQIKANIIAFLVFLTLSFFLSKFRLSRVVLITYLPISSLFLIASKIYFRNLIAKVPINLVLVGDGHNIKNYYEEIKKHQNYKVKYWVSPPGDIKGEISVADKLDLDEIEKSVDSVVVGFDLPHSDKAHRYLKNLSERLIPIIYLPDLQLSTLGHTFREYKGQTLIYLNEPKIKTFNMALKRLFDIVAVSIGMLLISPLLLILAALVKFTSKGPIFYGQVRMGLDGKEFKMWKFRSMVTGKANKEGWTVKDDPRVTPIGKILRKTSLDEFPQLWNVLMGDMSLVGPRPERPMFVNQFKQEIPSYMLRHKFKAGITGWAQINGWRGDTSIEKRIECDLWYIRNWSIGLDIYIIFMTFWKGFINKNAY